MLGHMTGQVWTGAVPNSKDTGKDNVLSRSPDLAKLNPNVI